MTTKLLAGSGEIKKDIRDEYPATCTMIGVFTELLKIKVNNTSEYICICIYIKINDVCGQLNQTKHIKTHFLDYT